MFLLPDTKQLIYSTVEANPQYDLFGCMTNRLNPRMCPDLLVEGAFDQRDILKHYQIAQKQAKFGTSVKPTTNPIAGVFMCFKSSVWSSKPFIEDSIMFDQVFSQGLRCGVMQGVYILHYYRMHKDYRDYKHLL